VVDREVRASVEVIANESVSTYLLYGGPRHPAIMALLDTLRSTLAQSPLAQSPELRMSRRGGRLSRR
jgi:hypothetical protein